MESELEIIIVGQLSSLICAHKSPSSILLIVTHTDRSVSNFLYRSDINNNNIQESMISLLQCDICSKAMWPGHGHPAVTTQIIVIVGV